MYTNVIVNVLYNSAIYIKHMYYKEKFAQNPQQKVEMTSLNPHGLIFKEPILVL